MRHFVIFCTTLLLWQCSVIHIHAVDTALSVAPAILEAVTTPGKKNVTKVTVVNNTNFPLPIKGQVSAFLSNSTLPKTQNDTYNAASWFTLEPSDFILQPLEKKEVIVEIDPPKKSEPGGHYATIYFQPLIPAEILSNESTISLARIGALAFLVVPGGIHESLEITSTNLSSWQTFGPLNFDFSLNNTGNIHLLPIGQLEVKNIFGQVVATIPLDPSVIIPGTTKDQSLMWDKQILFGRYSATLRINYGTDHDPFTSKPLYIWFIPWPFILTFIVLLTLIYKIIILNFKRLKLAARVLIGKDVKELQITQENNRLHPSSRSRTHSAHARTKRNYRRKSN